ncbi:hypothetical protein [Mycobacterium sp. AT1]|uniref:hypothetical protein n=1 Tax=Mycobacterium sp. AT1 TaxID=1961706 RepID=UPI0009ABF992|nr:hypothetical protein [Mycobacterium sp. AT1]OPX07738.1 hypothetical protein B1790_21845 [Mycobacterium sp. AT1]
MSIYAGAAFGGAFWAGLPIMTSLWESDPPPHATLATVVTSLVVGLAGIALFRLPRSTSARRVGLAVSIGALIGLPVLGWFALW